MKSLSLVLMPGLDGTGIMFRPFVAALAREIQPTVVSYPSERFLTYRELLPLVVDALPKEEPFILLGESFSGPLAVMIAAQRPRNLVGLVLCASFVTSPNPMLGPAVRVFARGPLFRLYPRVQQLKILLGGYSTPELRALFAEAYAVMRPGVMAARARMVFQTDVTAALAACDLPMLYIAASRDRVVPARNCRAIQGAKPGMRVVTIDGPHMVLQARPVEAAGVVGEFAAGLGIATGPTRGAGSAAK